MTFTRRKFFTFSGSVAALSLFSQAEAMPVEPPTKYDGDFDIVIVGGGGAGLSAACAASELGASVLVLEKDLSWRILLLPTQCLPSEERDYKNQKY
ncbi:MAG: FAD-dependent oxidoreductase [Parasutterella excrementihominis]